MADVQGNPNAVQIGGNEYDVYANEAFADTYLEASVHRTGWATAAGDDGFGKSVVLVSATRALDTLEWKGGYGTFDERKAATAVRNACSEWAALIAADQTQANPYGDAQSLLRAQFGEISLEQSETRPTTPTAAVSDVALIAARLNMPTSVFVLVRDLLVYSTDDSVGQRPASSSLASGFKRTADLPSNLDDTPYSGYGRR